MPEFRPVVAHTPKRPIAAAGEVAGDLQRVQNFYFFAAAIILVYVFSFTFMLEQIRDVLAALVGFVCVVSLVIALQTARPTGAGLLLVVCIAILALTGMANLVMYQPPGGLAELVRNLAGMFILGWAAIQRFSFRKFDRFLTISALAAGVACLALAVINDPIYRAGTIRMGAITSQMEDLHPSAYLTVVMFFWLAAIAYFKRLPLICGALMLGLMFLLYAYKAEAAQYMWLYMVVAYAGLSVTNRRMTEILTRLLPILLILSFAGFFIYLWTTQQSWDIYIGSGRIGTWLDRIARIIARPLDEQLFGLGPGSDAFHGSLTWSYKATHSHNDFLSVTLEYGLIGLAAFSLLMISLVLALPPYLRVFATLVMLAGFFSGGMLFKPTVAPIMALAILHTRMMYDAARTRSGGRAYRPQLFSFKHQASPRPAPSR